MKSGQPYQPPGSTAKSTSGAAPTGRAAAVVGALVGREQAPVFQELETVGVAQAPRDKPQVAAVQLADITAAVHGSAPAAISPASVRVPNGRNAPVSVVDPGPSSGLAVRTLTPASTRSWPGMSWACGSRRSQPIS